MPWLNALKRSVRVGASRPSRAYAQLRQTILDLPGSDHGARLTPIGDDLLAILVEMPVAKRHRSTLVCVCDGATSLYLSSGGGFIGVGEVPTVRTLAHELLEIAANASRSDQDHWTQRGKPSRDTRFDFVTTTGVVTGWGDMTRRVEENAFLRVVDVGAQKVITEIRVSQSARPPKPGG